jgi:UDP-N-acetylmuramate dehydrogenase
VNEASYSLAEAAGRLAAVLPGRVERDVALSALTTYGLGGPAAVLVRPGTAAELEALAGAMPVGVPVLIVGRGSNLLVADHGFAGVAVLLEGELASLTDAGPGRVLAGAGLRLPVLARQTAAAGQGGLEFYVGIPGTVGGAVRMNAGGHGRDTAAVLIRAWTVDLAGDPRLAERPAAELGFGYRQSVIRPTEVVVTAEFAVTAKDPARAKAEVDEIVRWRRENQPGGANAGSVFTNPPGDSAGRLIEACGLKGLRVGSAFVSPRHANFFQADPGARAADVVALILAVQARVEEETGVRLVPEIRCVGFAGQAGAHPAASPAWPVLERCP